jgi:hypothetical protein
VSSGVSFDNSVCIAFIYVISLHVGSGIQYAVSCIPFHREDRSASPSSLPRIHPESRSSCSYRGYCLLSNPFHWFMNKICLKWNLNDFRR